MKKIVVQLMTKHLEYVQKLLLPHLQQTHWYDKRKILGGKVYD